MNLSDLVAQALQGAPATPPQPITPIGPVSSIAPPVTHHPGGAVAFDQPPGDLSDYQRELITARELATLAARLQKAKTPGQQELGRALFRAIRSEPFAQKGHRNRTAYQLAAEVVEAYPACDPETVVACFDGSISRVQEQGSSMTHAVWVSMITRIQNERQARLTMVAEVSGRIGKTLRDQAAQITRDLPAGVGPILSSGTGPIGADPADIRTLIISADGTYYLRRPDESIYRWSLKRHEALATELDRQFGTANQTVVTRDMAGEPIPMAEIVRTYATNAYRIVHDYRSAHTTWTPAVPGVTDGGTLHVGLPDRAPEAEPCALTHEWLAALAGHTEADTQDLYDWIAASTREHIGHPAAGLVIVGATGTGKSLLALALAATWGTYPVMLSNAVERFNGALLQSPFWWADERVPDGLSDAKFRELVQERSRLVEPKGQEKVELHGCGRIVITLNTAEDLRMGGVEGSAAVAAVVDRIAYFDCSRRTERLDRALEAMRFGPGHPTPHDVDLARIVRHLRWIQGTWAAQGHPRPQRFLGARADKSEARKLVLQQGVARQNDKVMTGLLEYLSAVETWEGRYHVEPRQFASGDRYPVITQHAQVWIQPNELAARLQLNDRERAAMTRMLKSLRPDGSEPAQLTFGNRGIRANYWPICPQKLIEASGLPEEQWGPIVGSLAGDTRDRLGT